MSFPIRPSSPTVLRLAAEACVDPRTVLLVVRGLGKPHTREAVRSAARRLALPSTDPIGAVLLAPDTPIAQSA